MKNARPAETAKPSALDGGDFTGLLGDDAIQMRKVERIDRDGRPCQPGQYRLAPQALPRLAQLVAGSA